MQIDRMLHTYLYVVDTHFELFYQAGKDNRAATSERMNVNASIEEELNIDTLRAYLKKNIITHYTPEHDIEGFSELVGELNSYGYKKISEIDSAINRTWEAYLKYEEENPPGADDSKAKNKGKKYNVIGVLRGVMSIFDDNFISHRKNKVPSDTYKEYRVLILPE